MAVKITWLIWITILVSCELYVEADITYISARIPLQGQRWPPGSPWPLPLQWRHSPLLLTINPSNFPMVTDLESCDVIDKALHRYRGLLFQNPNVTEDKNLPVLPKLRVHISSRVCGLYPKQDTDEQYELDIHSENGVTVTAREVWGALRGLETFSQLVYTSNNVEAMSYNKLNVFHWHIVDDQSFPYVSKKFPELSNKGAYSPHHVYTQADVAKVIEFARLRGIRVIPEFDTPGHTQSWGKAYPELLTPCWVDNQPFRDLYGLEGHARSENMDPTKNQTFEFMRDFFSEIIEVFKDEYIDLGMDEAHYYCWQSSPNISQFMADRGYEPDEYYKLEEYYDTKVINIVRSLGAKVFIYQDPIEHGAKVDKNTIVRVWKGKGQWQDYAYTITDLGYNVTITSCYYLNYISYGEDWRKYYLCDPQQFNGTQKQKDRILGGEASIWTEYVDETNLLSRLWPRGSAVAERLWSDADVNDTDSAAFRLDEHRCRMRRRGIPAQPVLPGNCGDLDLKPVADVIMTTPCKTSSAKTSTTSVCVWLIGFLMYAVF
ncbi:beta-hexosaminidase subunit beta-like isoform X2 [Liolophura sinensis]|uniref:beta-hexosaminidase subunit beta-like isoform X2 n=1 Tax=Liolophura sinensis TaxID=3198878 RepID=UPI003158D411